MQFHFHIYINSDTNPINVFKPLKNNKNNKNKEKLIEIKELY